MQLILPLIQSAHIDTQLKSTDVILTCMACDWYADG